MEKLFLVFVLVIPFFFVTGPSQADNSYPEFLEVTLPFEDTLYSFNATHNNQTISKSFDISQFRDVTFIDLLIEQSGDLIGKIEISVQMNDINASNMYQDTNIFDQKKIFFLIDDKAMIIPKTNNILAIHVQVSFKDKNVWDFTKEQQYKIRFNDISVKTSYRQSIDSDTLNNLNESNSQFTALILDPSYQIPTQGLSTGANNILSVFTYSLDFYVIVPKEIQSNYYLNITINSNYEIDSKSIFLENFGLISSFSTDFGVSYSFRYISDSDQAISKGVYKFNPKQAGIYYFDLQGYFFISESYMLFPGSIEMDMFLFFNVSIIIPVLFLTRLVYKRVNF
jgi:hypothetical protein